MDKSKILTPYHNLSNSNSDPNSFWRDRIDLPIVNYGNAPTVCNVFYQKNSNRWVVIYAPMISTPWETLGTFKSKEAAMAAADQKLIELGYTLLNEEEYNKLSVLI